MDPKEKEAVKSVSLYLPESLYEAVKTYTDKNGMTMNGLIKIAIDNELEKRGVK